MTVRELLIQAGYEPRGNKLIPPGLKRASVNIVGERSYHWDVLDPLHKQRGSSVVGWDAKDLSRQLTLLKQTDELIYRIGNTPYPPTDMLSQFAYIGELFPDDDEQDGEPDLIDTLRGDEHAINERCIDIALLIDEAFLHWRIDMQPSDAEEFLKRADNMCDAPVEMFDDLSKRIDECIHRVSPADDHTIYTVSVGREGSRVIYINIITSYRKDDPVVAWDEVLRKLDQVRKWAQPDEHDLTRDQHSITMRWWWD